MAWGVAGGVALGVAWGVALGVAWGVAGGVAWGVAGGLAAGLAAGLALTRLVDFGVGVLTVALLSVRARWKSKESRARLSLWLPYRHHDLLYFSLPGLRSFLVDLADEDPVIARERIAEASASIGQKRPAREALAELTARDFERAARNRRFDAITSGQLPFTPAPKTEGVSGPILAVLTASADLLASQASLSHSRKRKSLEAAEERLVREQQALTRSPRLTFEERRLQRTLAVWRQVIAEERVELERNAAAQPQVPTPFIAGPILSTRDRQLFRGRRDLVELIDHDLGDDRRGVLLLFGQRRMGKSSLLNLLPTQLGARVVVVSSNFQRLSGEDDRSRPDLVVISAIAKSLRQPHGSRSDGWSGSLAWLENLDRVLERDSRRLLVTIDEVEKLETGRREGWVGLDFLDFLRAAGDQLIATRFLLSSAYRPSRLGHDWSDRLISALPRELGPLDPDSARSLLMEPEPGFPDIYPPGGVDRILERTGRHPFLLQLVGDKLCFHLNSVGRLKAAEEDLDWAFEAARSTASEVFDELWTQRTPEEQSLLRDTVREGKARKDCETPRRELERDGFLTSDGRIAFPLFGEWVDGQR
ncbi:MAG: hypothetical protein SF066_15785 [Thermoanaerobaculia bacterium]|nr:hypothetical protein [Thermoanaerobaculia bacterium]